MGVWELIGSASATAFVGVVRSVGMVGGAVVWTGHAVLQQIPDRNGWTRIGRLAFRIADHVLDKATKPFTCGVPVYKFVKEELRSANKPQQQEMRIVKDERESGDIVEFATLRARIESLEKENMELHRLKRKMERLENKLTEIEHGGEDRRVGKRAVVMYWSISDEPVDLAFDNQEVSANYELCL